MGYNDNDNNNDKIEIDYKRHDKDELDDKRENSQENSDTDAERGQGNIKKKIDLMNFNNGWNDKNEQLLISIGENAASYKWMHENSSNFHNMIYNITSILLTVLSSLLSIQTLFPNDTCDGTNSDVRIIIIKQSILYIVTILSFLQTFLNSQISSQKHIVASGLFSELYHNIQQQTCMFRKDRMNAKEYISECLKKYDSLVIHHPDINSYIIKKFQRTFNNTGISLPGIQKIQIITEQTNDNQINDHQINDHQINDNQMNDNQINIKINDKKNNKIIPKLNKMCHLAQINNAFQINGDINDIELDFLRKKQFEHEYQRFLQHSQEND